MQMRHGYDYVFIWLAHSLLSLGYVNEAKYEQISDWPVSGYPWDSSIPVLISLHQTPLSLTPLPVSWSVFHLGWVANLSKKQQVALTFLFLFLSVLRDRCFGRKKAVTFTSCNVVPWMGWGSLAPGRGTGRTKYRMSRLQWLTLGRLKPKDFCR